jgi:thymidylate synthase ThyX
LYIEHLENSIEKYHTTLARLVEKGVSRKRAKESARLYLPYGNQITADVMFNFRSFVHFVRLRYSMHAQLEVREVARKMLEQVAQLDDFAMSLEAFGLTINGQIREPFE